MRNDAAAAGSRDTARAATSLARARSAM